MPTSSHHLRHDQLVDVSILIGVASGAFNLARLASAASLQATTQAVASGVDSLNWAEYRKAATELELAGATDNEDERRAALKRAEDSLRGAQTNGVLPPDARAECSAMLAVLSARSEDRGAAQYWAGTAASHHDQHFRALRDWAHELADIGWDNKKPADLVMNVMTPSAARPAVVAARRFLRARAGMSFPSHTELERLEAHARGIASFAEYLGVDTQDLAVGLRDLPASYSAVAVDFPSRPAIRHGALVLAGDEVSSRETKDHSG